MGFNGPQGNLWHIFGSDFSVQDLAALGCQRNWVPHLQGSCRARFEPAKAHMGKGLLYTIHPEFFTN